MNLPIWTIRHILINWLLLSSRLSGLSQHREIRAEKQERDILWLWGHLQDKRRIFIYWFQFFLMPYFGGNDSCIPSGIAKQKSFSDEWWNCNQRHIYTAHAGQEVQSDEINTGCRASDTWLLIFSVSPWTTTSLSINLCMH